MRKGHCITTQRTFAGNAVPESLVNPGPIEVRVQCVHLLSLQLVSGRSFASRLDTESSVFSDDPSWA